MTRRMQSRAWALAAATLLAGTAWAEMRAAPSVTVRQDETVKEDVYAAGSTVRVDGVIDGDLVVAAGTVEIPGHVTGDVLAAAGTVRVTGEVDGSLRLLGGQLELRGPVGEDVAAAVGTLRMTPAARIGRDVLASAGEVALLGPVAGDVKLTGGDVTLGARIGGKADLTVQSLSVESDAELVGPLTYRSAKMATVAPGARLADVERLEAPERSTGGLVLGFVVGWLRAFFAFTILGVLLAFVSPRFASAAPEVLRERPWRSLGWGAVALLLAPLAAFTLSLAGLLLGGWWLGLLAGAVMLAAVATAFPVVGFLLGRQVVSPGASWSSRFGALVLGVLGVTLVLRVPVLGVLAALVVVAFGLGAELLAGLELRRGPPPAATS